jgi:hypothetical protein
MDQTGKPMRGYVFVGARGCRTQALVSCWIDRAAANIESLVRATRVRHARLAGSAADGGHQVGPSQRDRRRVSRRQVRPRPVSHRAGRTAVVKAALSNLVMTEVDRIGPLARNFLG